MPHPLLQSSANRPDPCRAQSRFTTGIETLLQSSTSSARMQVNLQQSPAISSVFLSHVAVAMIPTIVLLALADDRSSPTAATPSYVL